MVKACGAVLALLMVLAMASTAVYAQIYASNGGSTVIRAIESGGGAEGPRLNFTQAFLVPEGEGVTLKGVALYLDLASRNFDEDMRLLLYSSAEDKNRHNLYQHQLDTHGQDYYINNPDELREFEFFVPDIAFILNNNKDLVENHPGLLAEFNLPGSFKSGRNEFTLTEGLPLTGGETYHIFLWTGSRSAPGWRAATRENNNVVTCPTSADWFFPPFLDANVRPLVQDWNHSEGGHQFNRLLIDVIGEPNHQPTGVEITGIVSPGEMLTANTNNIADENGLPDSPTFAYQWARAATDGSGELVDIDGETGKSYEMTSADVGMQIGVKVTVNEPDNHCYTENEAVKTRDLVNQDATGLALEGEALLGETLTADVSNIMDRDELPDPVDYTYQWVRLDADGVSNPMIIAGENSPTYVLQDVDVGSRVQVQVEFIDAKSNPEMHSVTSEVVNALPTGSPTISGTTTVGETLTANVAAIDDANGLNSVAYSYQWRRANADDTNEVDIGGANGSSYTLVSADGDKKIRLRVTFDDDDGFENVLDSDITVVVNVPATGIPSVNGMPSVGATLTVDTMPIVDGNGLETVEYGFQWRRANADDSNEQDIIGATGATYTLVEADGNKKIRVHVSFRDDRGNPEEVSTDFTDVIDAMVMGMPTITGLVRLGETLTADTSMVMDANSAGPITFEYQWFRVDEDGVSNPEEITGATSVTYVPQEEDNDKRLRVRVSFQDDQGNNEEATSEYTTPVVYPQEARGVEVIGVPQIGQTLRADVSGILDGNGLANAVFTFQWSLEDEDGRNAEDIAGATEQTYVLGASDVGRVVRVTVSYTDDDGYLEVLFTTTTMVRDIRQSTVLTHILSGTSQVAGSNLVDVIWQRVRSRRMAERSSFVSLGGRSLDADAFTSGEANHAAAEAAKFFGIEVVPAPEAEYHEYQYSQTGGSGVESYRQWVGLPNQRSLAERSAFALTLDTSASERGDSVLWGNVDSRSMKSAFSDQGGFGFSLSSRYVGTNVGIDHQIDNTLLGLIVISTEGDVEYEQTGAGLGAKSASSTVQFYVPWYRWTSPVGVELWTAMGAGTGTVKIEDESGDPAEIGLKHNIMAAGFRGLTRDYEGIKATAKADVFMSGTRSRHLTTLDGVNGKASRARLALETAVMREILRMYHLDYSVEFGLRYDDGQAQSGMGLDILAEFYVVVPSNGFRMHARSSLLVDHEQASFEEWAMAGGVEWHSRLTDEGFQLSLNPSWNTPLTNAAGRLWNAPTASGRRPSNSGASIEARLGYGAGVMRERALATTYGEMETGEKSRRLRVGVELRQQGESRGGLHFDVFGERRNKSDKTDSAVMLESGFDF